MTSFSLVPLVGETDYAFVHRLYGRATQWCPTVTEADIPATGHARHIWTLYWQIKTFSDVDLSERLYDAEDDTVYTPHKTSGLYAKTWLSLLHAEEHRRKTSS